MTSFFLVLLSFLQWNFHTFCIYIESKYTQIQLVYILLIYRQSTALKDLKSLWFLHWILWVVFCVVVLWVNGQKYENLPQLNTNWLAFLGTWCFKHCFSLSCSGYGLWISIKLLFGLTKVHIKNTNLQTRCC